MILATTLFEKSFLNIVTITFTSLIAAELLNVSSEVQKDFSYFFYFYQISPIILLFFYYISHISDIILI